MYQSPKYRVWDRVNKKFVDWVALAHDGSVFGVSSINCCGLNPSRFIVTSFTGQQDKNGKDIYVGDLVQGFNCTFKVRFGIVRRTVQSAKGNLVEVDIPSFYFENFGLERLYPIAKNFKGEHDLQTLEIIGNEFENPELSFP